MASLEERLMATMSAGKRGKAWMFDVKMRQDLGSSSALMCFL